MREKLYWNHKNEIPYTLMPHTVKFQELADGRIQIDQVRLGPVFVANGAG